MAEERHPGIFAGIVLVALGLALLASQFIKGLGGNIVVVGIGIAFLAAYFYQRNYGFLVPGGILTGMGLGILVENTLGAQTVVLGMGLGFISIWVIDSLYTHASNWWPLIPGGILLVIGLIAAVPGLAQYSNIIWPIALIVVGIVLLVAAAGRGMRPHTGAH